MNARKLHDICMEIEEKIRPEAIHLVKEIQRLANERGVWIYETDGSGYSNSAEGIFLMQFLGEFLAQEFFFSSTLGVELERNPEYSK